MSIIEAAGITKSFGEVHALRGVDLTIEEGTVYGLLGPNGAGKTTAVRVLATLLVPDGGKATVAGYDVVEDAAALRSVIGLAGQSAAVTRFSPAWRTSRWSGGSMAYAHVTREPAAAKSSSALTSLSPQIVQ